jgi:hypothetical protein
MGKLEGLASLAMVTYREILDNPDERPNVRADVATKVLESEGWLRSARAEGGKTFVLNLKTDDVVGALQGMRTVFSGDDSPIEVEEVKKIEHKPEREKKREAGDLLKKVIEAEKGV